MLEIDHEQKFEVTDTLLHITPFNNKFCSTIYVPCESLESNMHDLDL